MKEIMTIQLNAASRLTQVTANTSEDINNLVLLLTKIFGKNKKSTRSGRQALEFKNDIGSATVISYPSGAESDNNLYLEITLGRFKGTYEDEPANTIFKKLKRDLSISIKDSLEDASGDVSYTERIAVESRKKYEELTKKLTPVIGLLK